MRREANAAREYFRASKAVSWAKEIDFRMGNDRGRSGEKQWER